MLILPIVAKTKDDDEYTEVASNVQVVEEPPKVAKGSFESKFYIVTGSFRHYSPPIG